MAEWIPYASGDQHLNVPLDFDASDAYLIRIEAPIALPGWIAGPIALALNLFNPSLLASVSVDGNVLWIELRRRA